jgi:O-antigen/teichoic acid export membrane protein
MQLFQNRAGFAFQTVTLFLLDGLANVIDFFFHFWMGRVLFPADFAILQTLNSVMLVYTTASGVFQPVVGRFIAEAHGRGQSDTISAIFQSYLRAALWLGLFLAGVVFLFSTHLARFINAPDWTIQISALLIFLSTLRPIAVGSLQGNENFIAFGLARLALSLSRIVPVFFFMQAGMGLLGAVIALPFGWLASVLCAFLLLGRAFWTRSKPASTDLLREGWKLSSYSLFAYITYMSLTSIDLVWVNQNLAGELAGAYAGLVLMRRIVALLPAEVVTVMFPRVVKTLARGESANRVISLTALIILGASGLLALLYFLFSDQLITLIFGASYAAAIPLLGWMAVATIGVSLSSIWLNYYLAEKPRNFVILLGLAVALEWILLNLFPPSMQNAVLAFGITGWLLTLSGLFLYLFKAYPVLRSSHA